MKNEKLGFPDKQRSKRWLLPSAALIVGLCLPIYAYAYDQAACDACHNTCQSNQPLYANQCTQSYPGCPQAIYDCVNSMMSSCHTQCLNSACR